MIKGEVAAHAGHGAGRHARRGYRIDLNRADPAAHVPAACGRSRNPGYDGPIVQQSPDDIRHDSST
jgi:hypothetical protein